MSKMNKSSNVKLTQKEQRFNTFIEDIYDPSIQQRFSVDDLYEYAEKSHENHQMNYNHVNDNYNTLSDKTLIPDPKEREKLKKGLIRSYLERLTKKGQLRKEKQGNKTVFVNPNKLESIYSVDSVFCDIQDEVAKKYHENTEFPYPIKYAREIAQDKYHIKRDKFDRELEHMVKTDWEKFELGQGKPSFLAMSDSLDVKTEFQSFPTPYYFITKRCPKKNE